jgi:aspartate 1-decarboxylase
MSDGNQWELKVNFGKASSSFKREDVVYEAERERERVITYTWLILLGRRGRRCWKWSGGVAHQSQTQLQIVFCLYFQVRA